MDNRIFERGEEVLIKAKVTDKDIHDIQVEIQVEIDTGYGFRNIWISDRGVSKILRVGKDISAEYLHDPTTPAEWLISSDGYYPYCSRCGKKLKEW